MIQIAYLVSDYEAPSHTFVRREVAALRCLGTDIIAYSIRPCRETASEATSVLGRSYHFYVVTLVMAIGLHPLRGLSTWLLAARHRPPGWRAMLWSQFHFIEALVLARVMAKDNIDRLHVHFANSGAIVGMLAANYLQMPWSMTLHGISETDHPAGMLLAEKIERADFVACASYFMQAQAMRVVQPTQWPKLHIVRCGIDYDLLDSIPRLARKSSVTQLICVGRFSSEKGHAGLLGAIDCMRTRGVDCRLSLVGDGPSRAEIENCIERLKLADRVTLLGFLREDEALAAIAASDILVLPSLMEGLPVVLIEALALNKPVIASRVAGIPELVEEGGSGLLFSPSDWSALEDALCHLVQDRSIWKGMGQTGRKRVEEEFGLARNALRMQQLFVGEGLRESI